MKKLLAALLCVVMLILLVPVGAYAADLLNVVPTSSIVLVNGEAVSFQAYNIGDNNYFKLRDIAFVLSGTEK